MSRRNKRRRAARRILQQSTSRDAASTRVRRRIVLRRRGLSWLLATISLLLIGLGIRRLFNGPPPEIHADLKTVGEVSLVFSLPQGFTWSPMCGCINEADASKWRGISFLASELQLERESARKPNRYIIIAPQPGAESIFSPNFPFSTLIMRRRGLPRNVPRLTLQRIPDARMLTIETSRPLNINLRGRVTMGAWMPSDFSRVDLSLSKGMYPNDSPFEVIEEHFVRSELTFSHEDGSKGIIAPGVPLGDFIADTISITTDDPRARVSIDDRLISDSIITNGEPLRHWVSVDIIPPFAVRLATGWPEDDELGDSGVVRLSIPNPERQAEKYDSIYELMRDHPIVNRITVVDSKRAVVPFRYPPVPAGSSLNIFGSLSELTFARASGDLILGMKDIPIPAASKVSFTDIREWNPVKGVVPLPVQIDQSHNISQVEVAARAHLAVNGLDASSWWSLHSDALGLIFSFIGVVLAFIAIVPFPRTRAGGKT